MQHSWPGNVRELRNLAERYVLLGPAALDGGDSSEQGNLSGRETLSEMMDGFERTAIVARSTPAMAVSKTLCFSWELPAKPCTTR